MINIRLKEREQKILKDLKFTDTFKISGSSFIFMKIDVDGLKTRMRQHPDTKEAPKILKVQVPENKTPVLCLDSGKDQFLGSFEKVDVVELDADEILGGKWKLLLMNFLSASGVDADEIFGKEKDSDTEAKAD